MERERGAEHHHSVPPATGLNHGLRARTDFSTATLSKFRAAEGYGHTVSVVVTATPVMIAVMVVLPTAFAETVVENPV